MLTVKPGPGSYFQDVALFHKPSKTLLLCDALSMASSEKPELIVDYATLTGAARGAVGAEIGALFSNDDALAQELMQLGRAEDDAVWPMPLHDAYDYMIKSNIADLVNSAASPYAGAVTAALFLKRFIDDVPWVHFDVMAFNIPLLVLGGGGYTLRNLPRSGFVAVVSSGS